MLRIFLVPGLFLQLAATSQTPLAYADVPDIDVLTEILADWKQRQLSADTIRYEIEGTTFHPRGSLTGMRRTLYRNHNETDAFPVEDHTGPYKSVITIAFQHGWVRVDREREFMGPEPRYWLKFSSVRYDGKTYQDFTPLNRNEEMQKADSEGRFMPIELTYRAPEFGHSLLTSLDDRPLYFAHGITRQMMNFNAPIREALNPDDVTVAGRVLHEGADCVVLRLGNRLNTSRFDEIWVDPSRDSAIVRFSQHVEDRESRVLTIAWQKTEHGWLPEHWRREEYLKSGGLFEQTDLHVLHYDWNTNVAQADFQTPLQPGMYVNDLRGGVSQTYIHRGEKENPDDALGTWLPKHRQSKPEAAKPVRILRWLGVSLLFLGLIVFGVRRYRTFG